VLLGNVIESGTWQFIYLYIYSKLRSLLVCTKSVDFCMLEDTAVANAEMGVQ